MGGQSSEREISLMSGNNVLAGKETLKNSGLTIIRGDTMADAAQKVVQAVAR